MNIALQPLTLEQVVSRKCTELSGMGSEIRRMFLLGQKIRSENPTLDLIDLSLGNPDLEPPPEVALKLVELLQSNEPGTHRYMDNAGLPHVRSFLAGELSASEGVQVTEDSVFLSCGAAGALQIILRTLLDEGDEVVIFAPYFSEYVPYVRNLGGVVRVVASNDEHLPRLDELEKALNSRTKAVILNSPNNPSGVIYPLKIVQHIAELLRKQRAKDGNFVHLISDEPYARLVFGPGKVTPVLSVYEGTWLVRSHSKDLGLAGERIGYFAWTPYLAIDGTLAALRNSARALGFVNAPALMQRVLPHVFHASVDVAEYEKRTRDFVNLLEAAGIRCVRPGGSFFVFPRCPTVDDRAFCQKLLQDTGVLTVPGAGFGAPGYFRCSLTQSPERLRVAAQRIASFCADNRHS